MLKKLPNILTMLRIFLIPFFVIFFFIPTSWSNLVAAIIFVIACITDWLDGYLARKLQVCSRFGAFLDPVADKIMVCTALVLLVHFFTAYATASSGIVAVQMSALGRNVVSYIVLFSATVIISREIVISALREWMAEIGSRSKVAVSWIGKWKTAIQMVGITGLIWRDNSIPDLFPNWMVYCASGVLLIATCLTIWSMIDYLHSGFANEANNNVNVSTENSDN